jgi:hypothetical protein
MQRQAYQMAVIGTQRGGFKQCTLFELSCQCRLRRKSAVLAQEAWLLQMVQLSQQLARMHYTDLEHAVAIEMLQVHHSSAACYTCKDKTDDPATHSRMQ